MIITKTPFRVSFCGGGTDFPEFYHHEYGCVISAAINKSMYITLNKRFIGGIRVGYSKTEIGNSADEIQHPTARESLKFMGITDVEITSNGDLPAATGLGSSASFTVGLLNALHAYKGNTKMQEGLAKEASYIERTLAQQITGKQDHYIAACGGLCYIQFNPDESVIVERIGYPYLDELNRNLMLVYVGPRTIAPDTIQKELTTNIKLDALRNIKKLALELKGHLKAGKPPAAIGWYLNEDWLIKKQLASGISNPKIDDYYSRAIGAGAGGGKLLGAGGGGFMLIYCPQHKQERVKGAMGLETVPFNFTFEGSRIVYRD